MDYTAEIAKKIKDGKKIAIYAVGTSAIMLLNELKEKYQCLPAVLCDRDKRKQGKGYDILYNLGIMSIDEALAQYPDIEVFIAASNYRHQIIGELTESGKMPPERIINYVPVEKRIGCHFLENRMLYMYDNVNMPCVSKTCPYISGYELKDAQRYTMLLRDTSKKMAVDPDSTICRGCGAIKEDWYPVNPIFTYVNYCGWNICNFKCIYCFGIEQNAKEIQDRGEIEFGELIHSYLVNGWLDENYDAILSTVGEPTLHPKRKKFYDAFQGYVMTVNTNGSIFDEDLFAAMNDRKIIAQISLDAGTKDTFAKVKGVDCFEKVVDNIRRYSEAKIGMVMLKYIFLPGINDSDADIAGFLDVMERANVSCANLAIEFQITGKGGHTSNMKVTDSSLKQMSKLKHAVLAKNKFCFMNTSMETQDLADVLDSIE